MNSITTSRSNLRKRHQIGKAWQYVFLASTLAALVTLAVLFFSILDQSMGIVAVQNTKDPTSLSERSLSLLSRDELILILKNNLSSSRFKNLKNTTSLYTMEWDAIYELVMERIVQPRTVASYRLAESIFHRQEILQKINEDFPNAEVHFKSWINTSFIKSSMSANPEFAGIRSALKGSLLLILITIIIAFPIGVGAAIYLEEYANKKRRFNRLIQLNIDNLAGVPSIIYGILGLAVFVRTLEPITSGGLFGISGQNGRTILSAGLTMALLILPLIIINAQEAIRSVPSTLRQAAFGLGATRWQTIWHHVLPSAMPGILTGTILSMSRAIGETAPLIIVGASTFITRDPSGIFSSFTALPIQIYNWTTRPQDQFRNVAAAAILVLLATLLSMNALAIILRNRFSNRTRTG